MILRSLFTGLILWALAPLYAQAPPADPSIPHLEKRGLATQFIVDGKPFLALSGELNNTDLLQRGIHEDRVAGAGQQGSPQHRPDGHGLELDRPEEGKYDFSIADAAIEDARQNNVRIAWLWFASWKNGLSSFPPPWVKANQERFPRAQLAGGRSVEVLSTLSENNREADARAFAALMRHVREVDKTHRVILVQIENEMGLMGDSRDRSPLADAAFAKPVPKELMDYLQKNKDTLLPEFRKIWEATGFKTSGTWEEVFGKGPGQGRRDLHGLELLALCQPRGRGRQAGIPHPDVRERLDRPAHRQPARRLSQRRPASSHARHLARGRSPGRPAVPGYLPARFRRIDGHVRRNGNPLFVPESTGDISGAAHAFYLIGQHNGLGYSAMGIDSMGRTEVEGPDFFQESSRGQPPIERRPFPMAYEALGQLAPFILEHQSKGTIAAAMVNKQNPEMQVKLGDYTLTVGLQRDPRTFNVVPDLTGYGLFMLEGPNEYLMAGNNIQVVFTPNTPGPEIAGLAWQESGKFVDGKWVRNRILGGDDSVLRFDIMPTFAAMKQSGSGVRLDAGEHGIQKVKVYRYR